MQDSTKAIPQGADSVPTLRDLYARLGPRNGIAARVVAHLAAAGTSVALSTVFNVIYGRSNHAAVTDAFLTVVAAEKERRADVAARTRALAA
ncbi:hypothetical protein GCM10022408_11660 [Hymenobacter fastidiosus]|uniref:Uncharacterized protein n=1 Tax=Hymenobacter fastidiosus TaxID=486264 RepID=A0ABP7RTW2_9BACT